MEDPDHDRRANFTGIRKLRDACSFGTDRRPESEQIIRTMTVSEIHGALSVINDREFQECRDWAKPLLASVLAEKEIREREGDRLACKEERRMQRKFNWAILILTAIGVAIGILGSILSMRH